MIDCPFCLAYGSPCVDHVVDPTGIDDDRVPGPRWWRTGSTEIDGETNRRWCDLIHRGRSADAGA